MAVGGDVSFLRHRLAISLVETAADAVTPRGGSDAGGESRVR